MSESFDELFQSVMVLAVFHHLLLKSLSLLLVWQLTVDNQECNLQKVALFSELLDWISSVFKNSFFAIDETNSGYAVDRVHVGWVKTSGDGSRWALDL